MTAKISKFDLSAFDTKTPCDTGVEVELKHPTKGGIGIFLKIVGKDGGKFKEAGISLAKDAESAIKNASGDDVKSRRVADDWKFKLVSSCVTSWRDTDGCQVLNLGGKPLPFSFDNVLKLISDDRFPWICEQLDRDISNLKLFIPDSKTSS